MTTLMRTSNDDLFSSKTATRELIRSRKYLELLREYSPRLSNWLTRFGSITGNVLAAYSTDSVNDSSAAVFSDNLID